MIKTYQILDKLLSLIASKECLLCKETNLQHNCLCFSCWAKFNFIINNPENNIYSIVNFNKISQKIIHQFKYNDRQEYLNLISNLMVNHLKSQYIKYDYIVPIPISYKKLISRNFNQTSLIAKKIARISGARIIHNLLKKQNRPTQSSLSRKDRQKNVSGIFSYNNKYRNISGKILLIDDVTTTNSTLNEAIKTLNKNNIEVTSFTFAKTYHNNY